MYKLAQRNAFFSEVMKMDLAPFGNKIKKMRLNSFFLAISNFFPTDVYLHVANIFWTFGVCVCVCVCEGGGGGIPVDLDISPCNVYSSKRRDKIISASNQCFHFQGKFVCFLAKSKEFWTSH